MKAFNFLFIVLSIVGTVSCEEDDGKIMADLCGEEAILDSDLFADTNTDNYSIKSASITGGCLEIKIAASGCDGNTWETSLIDSEAVDKSNPPQRHVKISLKNIELCQAFITKKVAFDLTPLRTKGNKVILHLVGWQNALEYEY